MEKLWSLILEKFIPYIIKVMKGSIPCIAAIVIMFFKAFIVKWYQPKTSIPIFQIALLIFACYIIYLVRSKIGSNERLHECIFIIISCLIGYIFGWISNLLAPIPDMSAYIDLIKSTTRFGWLKVMFDWDTIVCSIYFIAKFVADIYLLLNILVGSFYIVLLQNKDFDDIHITRRYIFTLSIIFFESTWSYHLSATIISLLQ